MTSWPSISLTRPLTTLVGHRIVVLGTDADGQSRQLLLEVRSEKAGQARLWWCLRPRDQFAVPKSRSAVCDSGQTLDSWTQETASIIPTAAAKDVPIMWGGRDWQRAIGSSFRRIGVALAESEDGWKVAVAAVILLGLGLTVRQEPSTASEFLPVLWWFLGVIGAVAVLYAGFSWLASAAMGVLVQEEGSVVVASEIEARMKADREARAPISPTGEAHVRASRPQDTPAPLEVWSVVSPDAPLSLLAGSSLLVWPIDAPGLRPVALEVGWLTPWDSARPIVSVTFAPLGSRIKPRTVDSSARTRLTDFCDRQLRVPAAHALVVPVPEWGRGRRRPAITRLPRQDDPTLSYEPAELVSRVRAISQPSGTVRASAPAAAQARVDAVKADYGELASDIAYRIENSALFDDSEPLTKEFRLLLMRWDDESWHAAPSALERLAMEVRLAFDTARNNAEALGFTHLPRTARARAVRAAKAAELALHATTDGERQAASSQLSRILSQLSLHYLPTSGDVPRMISETRPQLERKP